MSEPSVKLPGSADQLLRELPLVEPDFEAQAKAIEARLQGVAAGRDGRDGALLQPPTLAAEPGEPGPASSVRAAEAPRTSLAELARKSLQKNDDDAAELARELLAATAQSRRPSAEMVERVKAAGRASATPLPGAEVALDEAQRPSGVVARARAAQPQPTSRGTWVGVAGGVLALAACVALFVKSSQSDSPASSALQAERASEAARPEAPATAPAAPAKPGLATDIVSPESLAAAPAAQTPTDAKKVETSRAAGSAAKAAQAPAPPAAASGVAPEAVVLAEDPAPAEPVAKEKKAEPESEPSLRPAEGNSTSVPLTPSAGAVSTALSSVRSGAQACLAGQTQPVSATVTFASDGHVLRVSATGPSGACIQAALSKARIQPFARDSFSASTVVRPP